MHGADAGNAPSGGPGSGGDGNAGDGNAGDGTPTTQIVGWIYILVGASATALMTGLVIYLIYLGDRGNTIAGPLSLLVGFVTLVVTLLLYLASQGVILIQARPWLRSALMGLAIFFVLTSLSATSILLGVAFSARQIPVTNAIKLTNALQMRSGDTASIVIPEPTRRSAVSIKPTLTSQNPGVGNCEDSTLLSYSVVIDGVPRKEQSGVRHETEVEISLNGAVDSVSIQITLTSPRDTSCILTLRIAEAFLYNSER